MTEERLPSVLIIVPAFNEAAAIRDVIRSIAKAGPGWDITVVNDGSIDNTGKIAEEDGNVMVMNLCSNLGIGGAMQAGFRFAVENGYEAAVQVDGDGQHPASEIQKLLDVLSGSDADVVIGSRFFGTSDHGSFQSTLPRRTGIRVLRVACKLLSGYSVHDVTSGFRAYNSRALAIIAHHYPIDFPEPESLVLYRKAGLSVVEVPAAMHPRKSGVSSIKGVASIYYMVKVLFALAVYSLSELSTHKA